MVKIGFIACNTYARELNRVVEKLDNPDLFVSIIPSYCCSVNESERILLRENISVLQSQTEHIEMLVQDACSGLVKEENDDFSIKEMGNSICLENVVPPDLLKYYIENNYYIVTPGWLMQWENFVVKRWKFDKETAQMFFKESAKSIMVFDTGIYNDYKKHLVAFSEFCDLPYIIQPIGIEYLQKHIENVISLKNIAELNDQILKIKKESNKRISELAIIVDLIPTLSKVTSEDLVIGQIFELFTLLFAPSKMCYLKCTDGKPVNVISCNKVDFDFTSLTELCLFDGNSLMLEDKNGFIVKLKYDKQVYGYVLLGDVKFPQYIKHYLNLALNITSFCGLLISNARKYHEIEEAKKAAEVRENEYCQLYEEYRQQSEVIAERNDELMALNEELKAVNDALFNANDQLKKDDALLTELNATKDKFFSIIAHDLKNPFNALLGFSNMLLKHIHNYDDEKLKMYSTNINESSKQTYALLEGLLQWSRMQTGALKAIPERLNSRKLIEDVVHLMHEMAERKNIKLLASINCDTDIYADNEMIKTVLRNLISNALKFTYEDGEVLVWSECLDGVVKVSVKDTGMGIEPEQIDKLFKVENKMSKEGTAHESGTGLGLMLCKEFVEKNGGEIWVESELGKGSVFSFTVLKDGYRSCELKDNCNEV